MPYRSNKQLGSITIRRSVCVLGPLGPWAELPGPGGCHVYRFMSAVAAWFLYCTGSTNWWQQKPMTCSDCILFALSDATASVCSEGGHRPQLLRAHDANVGLHCVGLRPWTATWLLWAKFIAGTTSHTASSVKRWAAWGLLRRVSPLVPGSVVTD